MAAGDSKLFNDFVLKDREGAYADTDTYQIVFLSDTYASVNTDLTNPTKASFTVTSGGNVAASYTLSVTINRSGATTTFDATDLPTISKNASNPADLRCALLIDNTVTDDAIQVWDMTTDGTTPLDLVNNDFSFTFGAGGINTSTNNNP